MVQRFVRYRDQAYYLDRMSVTVPTLATNIGCERDALLIELVGARSSVADMTRQLDEYRAREPAAIADRDAVRAREVEAVAERDSSRADLGRVQGRLTRFRD